MLIQCPACHTQAKLPESKEGAKVRCSECERVYVARPFGARGKRKEDPTKYFIIGGAVVLLGAIMILSRGGDDAPPVVQAEEEPEREVATSLDGWDSPLVKLGRELHESVHLANEGKLVGAFHEPWVYERITGLREPAALAGGGELVQPPVPEALATGEEEPLPWDALARNAQVLFMAAVREDFLEGASHELIGDWVPYDGWVVIEDPDSGAAIRLRVQHRDASLGLADRHVEWRLAKVNGAWRAWSWGRWISPDEEEKEQRTRTKKTVKKTLSDGSLVIEGVVRPIPYEDDTPQELRDEVESLIDQMIDLEARPKNKSAAERRLVEIGTPAVPGLLSRLAASPLETEDQAIQLNLIHLRLQEITGYLTTFDVHVAMGTTEERQASGIKQWFGWYDRKWKKFKQTGKVLDEDPLWDDPAFRPRNERERLEFEELQRQRDAQRESQGSGGD